LAGCVGSPQTSLYGVIRRRNLNDARNRGLHPSAMDRRS